MHKKVTISLPPELAERWTKQVKRHGLVKSVMIQNYLEEILPKLETRKANEHIRLIVEEMNSESKKPHLFD